MKLNNAKSAICWAAAIIGSALAGASSYFVIGVLPLLAVMQLGIIGSNHQHGCHRAAHRENL